MKPPLIFAALLLCASVVRAQPVTPSAPLAQVDPVALNLLARMSWKYHRAASYETYIDIKENGRPAPGSFTTRFRTDMGQFVWSQWSPDKHWRKWIFSGKTVVGYDSDFPGLYTHRKFVDFSGRDFSSILDDLGLDYTLLLRVMSGDWPGQLLAHPNLREVSMKDEDGQRVVTLWFHFERSFEGQDDSIRFFIEPQTLLLSRIRARQTIFDDDSTRELITEETYSQARFEPKLGLHLFDIRPPLHYKPVENFYAPRARR